MGRGNDHRDRRRQFGTQPADPWGDYAPQSSSFERPLRPQAARASSGPEKGFGFVELTDGSGEAFLYIRQVEAAGHSSLESGTTLVVQVEPGQKGAQITEIISVDTSTAVPGPTRRSPHTRPDQSGGPSRPGETLD